MPKDKKEQDRLRRQKCDAKQRALGRVGRKKWWTPEEHDKGDDLIKRIRQDDNV